jgi:hypothetical protein
MRLHLKYGLVLMLAMASSSLVTWAVMHTPAPRRSPWCSTRRRSQSPRSVAGPGVGVPEAGPGPRGNEPAGPRLTGDDAERALGQLRRDNAALDKFGSREDAIADGYKFKGGDDHSGVIPWQKLNTADDTQAWVGQVVDDYAAHINAQRGGKVMSDAAIDQMVEQRAKTWNEDPATLRGELAAAGANAPKLAAQMEASYLLANKGFQDSYALAQRIANGNYFGYANREAALDDLKHRMAQAVTMYGTAKAISSNAARTMRRMRGEFRITDEQLANIREADGESMLSIIKDTNGDPALLAQAARITLWQRAKDWLGSLYAANFLWSWKTQVVNFATSAAQTVWRPLETGLGSLPQQGLALVKGDEELWAQARSLRTQSLRETTYAASMLQDGLNAALKAFTEGDSILTPHTLETFTPTAQRGVQGDLAEVFGKLKPLNTMDDVVHNAMVLGLSLKELPTLNLRVMGAADEFVKMIRYRSVVAAKASVEADALGLSGQAFKDHVNAKLAGAFDDLGRGVDQDAVRESLASTFQQNLIGKGEGWLGPWAASYSAFASQVPLARIFTPFIKTPANLFRYGVKLTPGLNLLQKEYTQMLSGAAGQEQQARAMGQMMLGIMLTSSAASLWANGRLTGAGPQNNNERAQWMAEGNRPYSITWVNEKGERQFFELSRWDPVVMPLMLAADYMTMWHGGALRDEDLSSPASALTLAFAHLARDKTMLKNLNDAIGAASDDKKMSSFATRLAPGFVPFSSLMSTVNPDPYLHEMRNWYDGILARVPGVSDKVPPKRDFLGDKIMAPQGFASSMKKGPLFDALNEMATVTGRFIDPPAPKSAQTGGLDLRDYTLKDGRTAFDRYQELVGRPTPGMTSLKDTLTNLVQTDAYQRLPHGGATEKGTKENLLMEHAIVPYRQAAWKVLLSESPELRQATMQRKLDTAKAVATGAKDVKAVGAQGRMDVINSMLQKYGISLPTFHPPSQ